MDKKQFIKKQFNTSMSGRLFSCQMSEVCYHSESSTIHAQVDALPAIHISQLVHSICSYTHSNKSTLNKRLSVRGYIATF